MVLQYPLDRLQQVRTQRQVVVEHLLCVDEQGVRVGGLQETGEQSDCLRVTGAVEKNLMFSLECQGMRNLNSPIGSVAIEILMEIDEATGDFDRITFGFVQAVQQPAVEVPNLLDVAEEDF